MKFKVGQKVRMVENNCNSKRGNIGIIRALPNKDPRYAVEFPCFKRSDCGHSCDGLVPSENGHWIYEGQMEPLVSFQEKLDRFTKEPVGFLVKSKEIADELTKVFERKHMKTLSGGSTKEFMAVALSNAKGYPGDAYVCYNVEGYEGNLMHGTSDFTSEHKRELLDVTLDELKEYLESSPQTLEEKLKLTPEDFKGNEQEEHMKITIETDGHHKTTAECNGITAESLCNPMDEFKLPKGVHMAVQRLLEKLEEPEEDTGFHVGDIVEVVANVAGFSGNPIGLQGIVGCSYKGGANVKLPTREDSLTFYDRELKLIRRGNN